MNIYIPSETKACPKCHGNTVMVDYLSGGYQQLHFARWCQKCDILFAPSIADLQIMLETLKTYGKLPKEDLN